MNSLKKIITYTSISTLMIGMIACKPQKCKNFADPRNSYHVKYDKKGLVKSKNKSNSKSSWTSKF